MLTRNGSSLAGFVVFLVLRRAEQALSRPWAKESGQHTQPVFQPIRVRHPPCVCLLAFYPQDRPTVPEDSGLVGSLSPMRPFHRSALHTIRRLSRGSRRLSSLVASEVARGAKTKSFFVRRGASSQVSPASLGMIFFKFRPTTSVILAPILDDGCTANGGRRSSQRRLGPSAIMFRIRKPKKSSLLQAGQPALIRCLVIAMAESECFLRFKQTHQALPGNAVNSGIGCRDQAWSVPSGIRSHHAPARTSCTICACPSQ